MDIKGYIKELKSLERNVPIVIDAIAKKSSPLMFNAIRTRLYGTGKKGDGNAIGNYKNSTIRRHKKRTNFITLFNTGDFYNKFALTSKKGNVRIWSRDKKNSMLEDRYGENILSLTEEEEKLILERAINKRLQDIIDQTLNNQVIEI